MKKRTVIQRCNSWINFPGKVGKQSKEVSVSLAFDFVFVCHLISAKAGTVLRGDGYWYPGPGF